MRKIELVLGVGIFAAATCAFWLVSEESLKNDEERREIEVMRDISAWELEEIERERVKIEELMESMRASIEAIKSRELDRED